MLNDAVIKNTENWVLCDMHVNNLPASHSHIYIVLDFHRRAWPDMPRSPKSWKGFKQSFWMLSKNLVLVIFLVHAAKRTAGLALASSFSLHAPVMLVTCSCERRWVARIWRRLRLRNCVVQILTEQRRFYAENHRKNASPSITYLIELRPPAKRMAKRNRN